MFEIQFQGLITHARVASSVDGITRQIAVLFRVAENEHVPLLTVRNSDLKDTNATHIGSGKDGTTKCYLLKGEMTLNLPKGLPDLYLSDVPSLSELSTGRRPKASVGNRDTDESFSAFVTLAKGSMFIGDWFEKKAIFFDGTPAVCLPRTVIYGVSAVDNVILSMTYEQEDGTFGTSFFELSPNAAVRVSNIEETEDYAIRHFTNYALLFDPRDGAGVVQPIATDEPCEMSTSVRYIEECAGAAHMSVDCTNTTFP